MCNKKNDCLFIIAAFIFASASAFAEIQCKFDATQGIGALGRIESRSRVIRVSHNAGPEGARVEQLFFQEADRVKSDDKLAILSDHDKKKAEVEAARTRIKVLEAQLKVEQVALAFNKREHQRYALLVQNSAASGLGCLVCSMSISWIYIVCLGVFMGTETLNKLRSEALMLSEVERAELAYALVKSLDAPIDMGVSEAWDKEIQRRLAEIDAGTAKLIDRDEFRRRMRTRIGG